MPERLFDAEYGWVGMESGGRTQTVQPAPSAAQQTVEQRFGRRTPSIKRT